MTEDFDDSLLNGLIGNSDTPADDSGESIMRWFLRNYGTFNGAVVQLRTGKSLPKNLALDEWGAKYSFEEDVPDSERTRMVNPIARLFASNSRVEIHRFGMWPQQPYGYIGDGLFNTFTGWLRQPITGDVTIWFNFVDQILIDIPGAADYFHDWVAHMVCRPWQKHNTFITLAGRSQGVGKSFLGASIAEMLGTNDTNNLDQRQAPAYCSQGDGFLGTFNKELEGKVFVVVDELGTDKSKHVATMKGLVTSKTMPITAKFKDTVVQDNYVNFFLTTNQTTAMLVDDDSRRDVIFNIQQHDRLLMKTIISQLATWQKNGGYEVMLAWYLERGLHKDFAFDYFSAAPRFLGFERNVFESKSDIVIICDAMMEAIVAFDRTVALTAGQLTAIAEGMGYNLRGLQISREYNKRAQFIGSEPITVKKKTTRFSMFGTNKRYDKQQAVKDGVEFSALYIESGSLSVDTDF